MSDLLNLELLDADGAIRGSAENAGLDRGDFLKKGALAGGGLIAGGAFFTQYLGTAEARISSVRRSKKNDVAILNFALTLEFLEAEFYEQALDNKAFGTNPALKRFTEVVAKHEAAHVTFLRNALGGSAIKKPKFDFGNTVKDPAMFADTSQLLEDTGVTAYLGQVANVLQATVLKAAGTIVTVEARHAAWIRFIINPPVEGTATKDLPAPRVFDQRKSEKAILKAVKGTGFIQ
ncbi:MAG: ferritin-like domain-containing protein [Solirubrobacteraceae bacterium]